MKKFALNILPSLLVVSALLLGATLICIGVVFFPSNEDTKQNP